MIETERIQNLNMGGAAAGRKQREADEKVEADQRTVSHRTSIKTKVDRKTQVVESAALKRNTFQLLIMYFRKIFAFPVSAASDGRPLRVNFTRVTDQIKTARESPSRLDRLLPCHSLFCGHQYTCSHFFSYIYYIGNEMHKKNRI